MKKLLFLSFFFPLLAFADSFDYCGRDSGRDCPAPDKDADGYTTDGSGRGFDCDDNDFFQYPGTWVFDGFFDYRQCQADGTYAAGVSEPCELGAGGTRYFVDFDKTTAGTGTFADPFKDMAKLSDYWSAGGRPSGWVGSDHGDCIVWKGTASPDDEFHNGDPNNDFVSLIHVDLNANRALLNGAASAGATSFSVDGLIGAIPTTGQIQIGQDVYDHTAFTGTVFTVSTPLVDDYPDNAYVSLVEDPLRIMAWPGEVAQYNGTEENPTVFTLDGAHVEDEDTVNLALANASLNTALASGVTLIPVDSINGSFPSTGEIEIAGDAYTYTNFSSSVFTISTATTSSYPSGATVNLINVIPTTFPPMGNVRIGSTLYRYDSYSGSTLIIDVANETGGLAQDEAAGTDVRFWKAGVNQASPIYIQLSSSVEFYGGVFKGTDSPIRVDDSSRVNAHGFEITEAHGFDNDNSSGLYIDGVEGSRFHHFIVRDVWDFGNPANENNTLVVVWNSARNYIHDALLEYKAAAPLATATGARNFKEKHGSQRWEENADNRYFSLMIPNAPKGIEVAGGGTRVYNNYVHSNGGACFQLEDPGGRDFPTNNVFENSTCFGNSSIGMAIDYDASEHDSVCDNNTVKRMVSDPNGSYSGVSGHVEISTFGNNTDYSTCLTPPSVTNWTENLYIQAAGGSSQFAVFAGSTGTTGKVYDYTGWTSPDTSGNENKPAFDTDSNLVTTISYSEGIITTPGFEERGYRGSLGADETGMLVVTPTTTTTTTTLPGASAGHSASFIRRLLQ